MFVNEGRVTVASRRRFGSVRKRASGRWQVEYWHEGRRHSAGTFAAKADAYACLSNIEADLRRGRWVDPRASGIDIETYSLRWLSERTDLAVRTVELYQYLLSKHVNPVIGHVALDALSPSRVRSWHSELSSRHPSTAAKAYRLLSTVLKTAVADGYIHASPCKVRGAGVESALERPTASVSEIDALAGAMPDRMGLIVLLAAWCQLRRGEILGLRRCDIDISQSRIRIQQTRTFKLDGKSVVKEPKTAAGRRVVSVPESVMLDVEKHLARFTAEDQESLLFTGQKGGPLTASVLQQSWSRARIRVGRQDLHLHDLRHTGLTLAAATGATTAELMHRAGHSSVEAALRYQHATRDRDRIISDALESLIKARI